MNNLNRSRNLKLICNKASHMRNKIKEAYENQQEEIDKLMSNILEYVPRSKIVKTNLEHIIEKLFYKRPSKTIILFLNQLQGYPDEVLVNCINDFMMYLLDHKERKKPSVRLFHGYLKTALMSYNKKNKSIEIQDLGL